MPLIEKDENFNKAEEVADFLLFMLREDRVGLPRLNIFQILLGKLRPGMSSEILTASITSRFNEIGIPNGPLEGGKPNVMENYTKVMSEEIVNSIQNDMRVDVAVDPGMSVQASGANGGGPLVAVGASTAPHTAVGIAR